MAVELLRGKGYDFDCDWWSLGCILFEMLVGFPPFCADTPHDVFSNVMNYKSTLENPDCGNGELYISTPAWNLITRWEIYGNSIYFGKNLNEKILKFFLQNFRFFDHQNHILFGIGG
jgi:serine/threonine protein kinase